jgi:quercetin dioxygenase-like cupin family protein
MPELIDAPTRIEAAGSPPKQIEEFVGRVNNGDARVSIAVMTSPPGWEEPFQTPEFDEYTLVLEGCVIADHEGGSLEARPGQTLHAKPGERVRYHTPDGARYVAVCLPAFAPDIVHRD